MRLIDADALGVGLCSRDILPADYCAGWNGLVRLIGRAPTVDAVPVVRCKDCKHCGKGECGLWCALHDDMYAKEDYFCADGERRETGT